jgi:hypothetical protein
LDYQKGGAIVPTVKLDDLVRGMKVAVGTAQASIAEGHRGRVERLHQIDQAGQTEQMAWSLVVEPEAGSGQTSALRLPLATLRPYKAPQVTEVTLELEAKVEEAKPPSSGGPGRLRLVVRRRGARLRRGLHKLAIQLRGTQPGEGEIRVDGVRLKSLDRD